MGLYQTAFDANPSLFTITGVEAGDAAEMESRLQALIDASAAPSTVRDMVLTGVGEGPGWQAALVLDESGAATEITRAGARVAAAVATGRAEAYLRLLERITALNAEAAVTVVGKVEVAGNGHGSSFMALALVGEAPG